jgi:hypothetical protein
MADSFEYGNELPGSIKGVGNFLPSLAIIQRWTDHPPKESYQMSKGSISKKEKSDALKRHKDNEKEEI